MKKLLLVIVLVVLLPSLVGCTQSQKTLKEQQITNNELIDELEQKLGADFVLERKGNILEIISLKQE